MRYAAVKNGVLCYISNEKLSGATTVEIGDELNDIPSKKLLLHGKLKDGKLIYQPKPKEAGKMKLACVSNFKTRCGIAIYAEKLWSEVLKDVGDYRLFIERADDRTGSIYELGGQTIPKDKVVECWKRGESLKELAEAIRAYDPDIVWIQHEYGIFPNARYWLSLMTQLSEYRVIVTMHSVFYHKDKTIVEAAIPELIVHHEGAKKLLKEEKGVPGKVHVIGHGSDEYKQKPALWNFYKSQHTFITTGFGLKYKQFELAIQAGKILKPLYSDIFFTAIFSENAHNSGEHELYYRELLSLTRSLGLEDNVALIRGYQSDESLDSYLRMNKVAVFPYGSNKGHEVFGASGAARTAMAAGVPVVSSSIAHFSDLPTIKANNPEEIAAALDELFCSEKVRLAQIERQCSYLAQNSWANVAKKHVAIFNGS